MVYWPFPVLQITKIPIPTKSNQILRNFKSQKWNSFNDSVICQNRSRLHRQLTVSANLNKYSRNSLLLRFSTSFPTRPAARFWDIVVIFLSVNIYGCKLRSDFSQSIGCMGWVGDLLLFQSPSRSHKRLLCIWHV